MRTPSVFPSGRSELHVLPVIRGLMSEVSEVNHAFETVSPDAVAVSLSKEQTEGLRHLPDDFEPELSRYDEIYVRGLTRFGEVSAPPPCYVAALEIADSMDLPVFPVDIDETSYTELYCASVSGTTLFRHSTRTWMLGKRSFAAETPEEYVRKIDRAFNNMRGFRKVEQERARWMARELVRASDGVERLLAVVEFERADDVCDLLEAELGRARAV
jgi:pheromone shutdown protein TraB